MVAFVGLATPVEITISGTANSWIDYDLDTYIASLPADVTGVHVRLINVHSSTWYEFGIRKNGSTDARYQDLAPQDHTEAAVGVDSNKIFEMRIESPSNYDAFIIGYYRSDTVFLTNAVGKYNSAGSWVDVSIASDTGANTAIGVILEFENRFSSAFNGGARKNGSTDNRTGPMTEYDSRTAIVGVDASEIYEQYVSNLGLYVYVTGYFVGGMVFNTNATNYTPGTFASYVDLTALPAGADAGVFEVGATTYKRVNFRRNGSAFDKYYDVEHNWFFVPADANRICEAKLADSGAPIYLVGYTFTAAAEVATCAPIMW